MPRPRRVKSRFRKYASEEGSSSDDDPSDLPEELDLDIGERPAGPPIRYRLGPKSNLLPRRPSS